MFIRILKLSAAGLVTGRVLGRKVPRNPAAWLPLLLLLPVAAATLLLFVLLFLLSLPILAVSGGKAWFSMGRKRQDFAERGVPFEVERAEDGLPVLEAEVVRGGQRGGTRRIGGTGPRPS